MSKTSRKSLPAVILTLCLLIAQAALFGQSSNTAHAATGAQIYLNPTSSTFGQAATVAVRGTGFSPNGQVLITFNSPYSSDGAPLNPRTLPPTVNRNGDNRPLPPNSVGTSFPNVIEVLANTDGLGNLITSNGNNGTISFGVPSTAVDGIYSVAAVDLATCPSFVVGNITSGCAYAATQYTIARSSNQQFTATPLSGSSVQIDGRINVKAAPNSFNNGDEIRFYLEDFVGSASFGAPSVPSFGSFDPLIPPAQVQVELPIYTCGTIPVTGNPGGSAPSFCSASVNGDVSASVQLDGVQNGNPFVLSTYYYDQVFAVVAKAIGNTYGLPYSANQYAAGVHVDHGQTAIHLSSNQTGLNGPVTVSGTGFGAVDTVQLYYATVAGGCPIQDNGTYFFTACLAGTAVTDANGAFTITVNIPALLNGGGAFTGANGFILAEDFYGTGTTIRLNEAATAALVVTGTSAGTLTIGTAAGGTSTTAAISSTVIVTGTGYVANEAVDVDLTGPLSANLLAGSGGVNQPLPPGAPFTVGTTTNCQTETITVLHANAQGVVTGSFLVPETCNTVTASSSSNRINLGAVVTVDAVGEQSGLDNGAKLNIPATTALISPVNGLTQTGNALPVTLSGSGFAANEPVTFQFGFIDPFFGAITTPVLSVSGISDALGNVSIPNQTVPGTLSGLYTLQATGLNSSFRTAVSVNLPFGPLANNGNLNCPANNVLPGQPFVVSGSNFAPGTTLFATVNFPTFQSVFIPTTAAGTFTYTFTAPLGTAANSYQLVISGLVASPSGGSFQEQLRACNVTIGSSSPAITANPTSGPIGITSTVTGAGFGISEPVQVSLQYIDTGALTGTDVPGTQQIVGTTDVNGNFSGVFTVKSNVNALIPGVYNLTATGTQTKLVARTQFIVTGGPLAPVTALYFPEGYTGTVAKGAAADFNETLSILNANNFTTTYTVTYFLEQAGGASLTKSVGGTIGANSVVERSVNTDVGNDQKVASLVSSPAPLAADRIIARSANGKSLDSSSSLGQLINVNATAPAGGFNYYFASGEALLTNEEYLTLLNPTSTAASVTVTVLPQGTTAGGTAPVIAPIAVSVPANSRVTQPIRALLTKAGITRFGLTVNSNVALASERVEYYGDGTGSGKYGASVKAAGSNAFRQYIFASDVAAFPSTGGNASAGTGNDVSEIDIVNPGASTAGSATVTVSFFSKTGAAINSQQVQVDGGTRETINVNDVVGTQSDVFSVIVTADKSIFVEKPVFYGGDPTAGGTHAVEAPSGSPAGLTSVAFPYLDTTSAAGAAISQTVYLYNPGATPITVRGTFVSNTQSVVKTYTIAANNITVVNVNTDSASLPKGGLGGIFQVVTTGSGQSDSFVASVVSNAPDFSNVVGDQGTYPIGAVTNP